MPAAAAASPVLAVPAVLAGAAILPALPALLALLPQPRLLPLLPRAAAAEDKRAGAEYYPGRSTPKPGAPEPTFDASPQPSGSHW